MSDRLAFGPFQLDLERGRLLRGATPIELRRKAFDVLRHLAERPDTVVSTDELLEAVWRGVAVTPQTLTNVVREIRLALGASAPGATPWIQTVRGRGFTFQSPGEGAARSLVPAGPPMVGREHEGQRLVALWEQALRGEKRFAFVTGEAGIGKTTLVDGFARPLVAGAALHFGRGACVEQHGTPENFLPWLTALEEISRGPRVRELVAMLRRVAPSWLMRLPHLLRRDERLRIEPTLVGATATRMLREGLGALRALADSGPLLVVIEDLHWADTATLDLLGALARSPAPARLLVVGTLRRADAAIRDHPVMELTRELVRERRADEIALGPFDVGTVGRYVQARLGIGADLPALAGRLEALSAGNPLFLQALVDELVENGAVVTGQAGTVLADDAERLLADLPESLRAFVASESARLPHPLRRIVEAASVIGSEALVPELATVLGRPPAEVADGCEQLAAVGRLLRRAGEGNSHDGQPAGRYAFPHAAHRRIVYDGLPIHDRTALHRKVALGLEAAYGPRAPSIAARLAAHFDQAGLGARAVEYHDLASTSAEARFAYAESAAHLAAALQRLDRAAGPGGDQSARSGWLWLRLGEVSVLAHGYSGPEVEAAYLRGLAICERDETALGVFTATMGLGAVDLTRARYRAAYERTRRLAEIAVGEYGSLAPIASCWAGFASSALGELKRARGELEAGVAAAVEPGLPRNFSIQRMLRSQLALVHTLQGDLVAGARFEAEAIARSRQHGAVSEIAHAGLLAAERAAFIGEPSGRAVTSAALALSEVNGLVSYAALLRVFDAALDRDSGPRERLVLMRRAIDDRAQLGDRWHGSLLRGLVAAVALEAGDPRGARDAVQAGLAHAAETAEHYYEAELVRLRAECILASGDSPTVRVEARSHLEQAVALAMSQGAVLWAERARARLESLAPRSRTTRASRRSGAIG